jgi:hypothetical protein
MAAKWGVKNANKLFGRDILERVRLKLSDTLVNKFSDEEILSAINEGIDYLWRALSSHFSTLTHKTIEYTLTEGSALLPDDFQSVVRIIQLDQKTLPKYDFPGNLYVNTHISGTHIFGEGWVRMEYNYYPRPITLVTDIVDIPMSLTYDLVNIVQAVVIGNPDLAQQRSADTAKRVSQFREFGNIEPLIAFP